MFGNLSRMDINLQLLSHCCTMYVPSALNILERLVKAVAVAYVIVNDCLECRSHSEPWSHDCHHSIVIIVVKTLSVVVPTLYLRQNISHLIDSDCDLSQNSKLVIVSYCPPSRTVTTWS